jgi:hypothetical protein
MSNSCCFPPVLLGIFVLFAAPAPALAQGNFDLDFGPGLYVAAVGFGLLLLSTPAFVVADIAYAADREWLSPLGAGLELALVGIPWLALGTAVFLVPEWDNTGFALGATALGVLFSAHAIASMVLYEPAGRATPPPRESERAGVRIEPWVAPDLKGAGLTLKL